MRELKNKLTPGKSSTNIQTRRGKSFGYQVLGFGSGGAPSPFIVATGGTPCSGAIDGDYKVHTFTGPGTFCVSNAGNPTGSDNVDYLVVAGAGGASVGGGGAGGYRTSFPSPAGVIPVTVQGYPITVGGGGSGGPSASCCASPGYPSIFDSITSTAGGKSGRIDVRPGGDGDPGGSGGGAGGANPMTTYGGIGNTPPTPVSQGNPGGDNAAGPPYGGGGGGGIGGAGASGTPTAAGGPGTTNSISGSPLPYSIGGTVAGDPSPSGAANTGSGGFGNRWECSGSGGAGGSGIVVIRYKFQ